MRKTTYLIMLLLCALCFANLKCKSTLDELPPETQEGKGTFAFLLNGEVWQPEGRAGLTTNFQPFLQPNGGTFSISTYRIKGSTDQGAGIFIRKLGGTGKYILDGVNHIIDFDDLNRGCQYVRYNGYIQEGIIEIIKYDMKNYIVAGRFEARLYNGKCDTIKITQGRFDIKFD